MIYDLKWSNRLNAMKVIDTHLHFDDSKFPNIKDAFQDIQSQLVESNIEKGIVLHLLKQNYDLTEIGKLISEFDRVECFVNINPFSQNASAELSEASSSYPFVGLKLHPRLQNFTLDDERVVTLCQSAGELKLPVLLDAFPDGTAIMNGFSALKFAELAKKCPNTKFIWAHFCGHYCIDAMMVAKRLPNVFLDLSFSLLYYRGSSVISDLMYCFKSMRYDRIFYGSDYPDRSIKNTLSESLDLFTDAKIDRTGLDKILYSNAKEFFNW